MWRVNHLLKAHQQGVLLISERSLQHDQWVTKLIFVFTPFSFFFSAGFQRADHSPHSHHSPDQFLMAGQLHSGGDSDHVGARCFRLSDGGTTIRQSFGLKEHLIIQNIHTNMYTLHFFIMLSNLFIKLCMSRMSTARIEQLCPLLENKVKVKG